MDWSPSNEPIRYDRARVERTDSMVREINRLGLPLIRQRKLNGILNALVMQIEDGGDSPEVNRALLEALREGLRHQVGEHRAKAVLRAIDAFEGAESERWEQVRAGTLPPIELRTDEQLDDLMQEGYDLLQAKRQTAACDKWLEAWAMVTEMATPDMRTALAFDKAYPGMMQSVFNWSGDLEMELHNAGLHDPVYHEHRVRYVNEFLARFPDEDEERYVMFRRALGEALWCLERVADPRGVPAQPRRAARPEEFEAGANEGGADLVEAHEVEVPRVHVQAPVQRLRIAACEPAGRYRVVDRVVATGRIEHQEATRTEGAVQLVKPGNRIRKMLEHLPQVDAV